MALETTIGYGERSMGERYSAFRIVYLAPGDIQIARVDRQAIVYFCSALARLGASVELVALGVRLLPSERHQPANPLELYQVQTEFLIDILPTRLHQESGPLQVGITRLSTHTVAIVKRLRRKRPGEVLVFYAKNYAPAVALLILKIFFRRFIIVFEAHRLPRARARRLVLRSVDGVVANSYALAHDLKQQDETITVLGTHQGVDLHPYEAAEPRGDLRRRLGLPFDRRVAVYTGKIYFRYEEIEYIVRAAAMPSSKATLFLLVGGRDDHVELWRSEVRKRGIDNVRFVGFVPPSDVHSYQLAADVLILYYPSGLELNAYRSPGKLFTYMASGVPLVAVDLPVLREVLGDPPAAVLVAPDSPSDLAAAIQLALDDENLAQRLSETARVRVTKFTWDARAERVLRFVDTLAR